MAHAKPIVINAAPLSTDETAEMLGVSGRDVRRIRQLVASVVSKHAAKAKRGRIAAPPGRDAAKPARGSAPRI